MNPYWLDILSKLKDQTRPSKSLKGRTPKTSQVSQTKDQRYHTVQNSNYLYFTKRKKFNIWKFLPCRKRGELEGTGLAPMQAASQVQTA